MTDKKIIIDSVDVSGCSYGEIEKSIFKCSCEYNVCSASMFCKDNPNCYYKQLKAKDQECERLKQTLVEIEELAEKIDDSDGCAYGDYDCDNCSSLEQETVCTYKVKKLILQKISEVKEWA